MGKVASSTIYRSLRIQYEGVCLHSHSFSGKHVKPEVRFLYKLFKNKHIPLRVITLIREPISRNISAFYENFERDLGMKFEKNPYSTEELQRQFLEKHDHKIPLIWLDHHILGHFNIDVYETPLPKEGFAHYQGKNVELLLMKHDLENTLKEQLLNKFLGRDSLKISDYNVGGSKTYSNSYKAFNELPLPKSYIDKMLESKYVNHFYADEKVSIAKKWT